MIKCLRNVPSSSPVPDVGSQLSRAEKMISITIARKNDGTLSPVRLNTEMIRSASLLRRMPAMNPRATPPTRPNTAEAPASRAVFDHAWLIRSVTSRLRYGE
jgi:hypothetical protein